MSGLMYENEKGQFETVVQKDLDELAELLDLRPWQIDRLGYWADTIGKEEECKKSGSKSMTSRSTSSATTDTSETR